MKTKDTSAPIHPGILLGQELKRRKIRQLYFVELTEIKASNLNQIIKGLRPITPLMAVRIEKALGVGYPAEYWCELQMKYELHKLRNPIL